MADMGRAEWRNLLEYYRRCLASELAGEVHRVSAEGRLFELPVGGVDLGSDTWTVSSRKRFAGLQETADDERKSLFLGYPIVVVEAQGHPERSTANRLIAPLLTVELQAAPGDVALPDRFVAADESPQVHFGLLKALGVEDEQLDETAAALPFDDLLERPLPVLAATLKALLGVELDPSSDQRVPARDLRPGLHDRAIVYVGQSRNTIRGLREELALLQTRWEESQKTALRWLMDITAPHTSSAPEEPPLLTPWPLNGAQEQAIGSILTQPLTVVTGPPGTGKSQLIANLVATCWSERKSVCVASTNNHAVDVVVQRLDEMVPGMIIRTGKKPVRENAEKTVTILCQDSRPGRAPDVIRTDAVSSWAQVDDARARVCRREELDEEMPAVLERCADLANRAGLDITRVRSMSTFHLRDHLATCERLSTARLLGDYRRRRFLRRLGVAPLGDAYAVVMELLRSEERRRTIAADPTPPYGAAVAQHRAERRRHRAESVRLAAELVRSQIFTERMRIQRNMRSIQLPRLRNGQTFADLREALTAWAVTSHSTAGSLPLTARLFDVLVIDEASQCSIPAMIPLLYRAEHVAVVGDPRQLTHVCSIDERTDRRLLKAAELGEGWERAGMLDYRRSLFEALDPYATARVFLDEHYRSHPAIAEAANAIFYDGRLTVLTSPVDEDGAVAMSWREARGDAVRGRTGTSAVNRIEAEEVVRLLAEIVAGGTASVGVVSPFRAQADLIFDIAVRRHRHLLVGTVGPLRRSIGTAHTFQGDERDVIIFSPVVSHGAPEGARRFLTRNPNLINVALTRARRQFIVVGDHAACASASEALRKLQAEMGRAHSEAATDRAERLGLLDSDAERALHAALLAAGLDVVPKLRWHHIEMDLAVRSDSGVLDVECDGDHHHTAGGGLRPCDISRDDLLEANGIRVLRVPDWRCRHEPTAVVAEVRAMLDASDTG